MSIILGISLTGVVGMFALFEYYRNSNKKKQKKLQFNNNKLRDTILIEETINTIIDGMDISDRREEKKIKRVLKKVIKNDCPSGTKPKRIKICI